MSHDVARVGLFAVLFLAANQTIASVAPNGNYFAEFTDAVVKADRVDRELQITRTYNSFSTMPTWFGRGWSTDLQNRLHILPSNNVIVRQNGVENIHVYRLEVTPEVRGVMAEREARALAQAEQRRRRLDEGQTQALEAQLLQDQTRRHALSEELQLRGALADGETLRGTLCDNDVIRAVAVPGGISGAEIQMERRLCRGGRERYDGQGRLLWRETQPGYLYTLKYQGGPSPWHPSQIHDSDNNTLRLYWSRDGLLDRVEHAEGSNKGKGSRYVYLGGNLVLVQNTAGTIYRHRYDKKHNLVETRYEDESSVQISYDVKDRVHQLTDRQGRQTRYEYPDAAALAKAAPPSSPDPRVVTFDGRGVVQRVGPEDAKPVFESDVHPLHGKVVRFKDSRGVFFYNYAAQGLLIEARRGAGTVARLAYGSHQYVEKLVIQDTPGTPERELQILYDDRGRIRQLDLAGRGSVSAFYDAAGKIHLSYPDLRPDDALQIFGMFGTLRMLTRPAGIAIDWRGL